MPALKQTEPSSWSTAGSITTLQKRLRRGRRSQGSGGIEVMDGQVSGDGALENGLRSLPSANVIPCSINQSSLAPHRTVFAITEQAVPLTKETDKQ
jgi:hypothetical protein